MTKQRLRFVKLHRRWLPVAIVSLVTTALALWCVTLTVNFEKPVDRPQDVLFIEATPSSPVFGDPNAGGTLLVDLTHVLRIRQDGSIQEALGMKVTNQEGKPVIWKALAVSWSGNSSWSCDAESEENAAVPQGDNGDIPSFAEWKSGRSGNIDHLLSKYSVSRLNRQPLRPIDHAEVQELPTDQHWEAAGINCSRNTSVARLPSAVTVADPVEAIAVFGPKRLVITTPHYDVIAPRDWSRLDGSTGVSDAEMAPAHLDFNATSYLGLDLNANLDLRSAGLSNDIEFTEPDRQREIDSSVAILTVLASALLGMVLQTLTWPVSRSRRPSPRIGKASRSKTRSRSFKRTSYD